MPSDLTCETCNSPIGETASALVEWVGRDSGASDFRISHDLKSSPLGGNGCSWHVYAAGENLIEQLPVEQFKDSELQRAALNGGVQDKESLRDVMRRLSDAAR